MSLGPGLFWSHKPPKAEGSFTAGWTAVPLPQQVLEGKTKWGGLGLGLLLLALSGLARKRLRPQYAPLNRYQPPMLGKPLYLPFNKLQTDGG
ncbi:MAG: hypothetical protein SFU83_04935 [Meiothermus sp.]|nr:hypothetical protein [Meiothermus sp.]